MVGFLMLGFLMLGFLMLGFLMLGFLRLGFLRLVFLRHGFLMLFELSGIFIRFSKNTAVPLVSSVLTQGTWFYTDISPRD
jgi:hypothetical protein